MPQLIQSHLAHLPRSSRGLPVVAWPPVHTTEQFFRTPPTPCKKAQKLKLFAVTVYPWNKNMATYGNWLQLHLPTLAGAMPQLSNLGSTDQETSIVVGHFSRNSCAASPAAKGKYFASWKICMLHYAATCFRFTHACILNPCLKSRQPIGLQTPSKVAWPEGGCKHRWCRSSANISGQMRGLNAGCDKLGQWSSTGTGHRLLLIWRNTLASIIE